MKERKCRLLSFLKELICWTIVLAILLFTARKFGWTDISVRDNLIGLTIGWLIWRAVTPVLNREHP